MAIQVKYEPIGYQWSKQMQEYYDTEICTMLLSHLLHVRRSNINRSQVHATCHVYRSTIKQYIKQYSINTLSYHHVTIVQTYI